MNTTSSPVREPVLVTYPGVCGRMSVRCTLGEGLFYRSTPGVCTRGSSPRGRVLHVVNSPRGCGLGSSPRGAPSRASCSTDLDLVRELGTQLVCGHHPMRTWGGLVHACVYSCVCDSCMLSTHVSIRHILLMHVLIRVCNIRACSYSCMYHS